MNKKGLLLAGLAAFAYYKYKKMSPESKKKMVDTLKDKVGQHIPGNLKNLFGSITGTQGAPEYGKGTF
jgi:hypothetical protein